MDSSAITNLGSLAIQQSTAPQLEELKCEETDGGLKIKWKEVEDVTTYTIQIKRSHERGPTSLSTEVNELLFATESYQWKIGEKITVKLITENQIHDESIVIGQIQYVIGSVPRNVKASLSKKNPFRCIQVTFDTPIQGEPDEYKVVVLPESKVYKKPIICKNSPLEIEYLRQGFEHRFLVSARYGEEWSEMSESNFVTTNNKGQHSGPVVNIQDADRLNVDLRNANILRGIGAYPSRGEGFGLVRDIKTKLYPREDKEVLTFEWKIPTFDNDAFDYKVEKYNVEIGKVNSEPISSFSVDFIKNKQDYLSQQHELEPGQTYNILISTTYIAIDNDEEWTSNSAKAVVVTRPCKPKGIKIKIMDEKLYLGWNHTKGANYYVVSLFNVDSDEPLDRENTQQKTLYERPFDDKFGFGMTYYATIEAVGSEGGTNSIRTENINIGAEVYSDWMKGESIGRGAFTEVFVMLNRQTHNKVGVVKEIDVRNCDANAMGDLKNEIKILSQLSHEHIVQYRGSTEVSNKLCLFMEYMSGDSVKKEINRNGPLTEQLTCKYTKQILKGLTYLHSNGILHRDIKAANVLQDGSGNVKLGDFGVSKKLVTIFSRAGQSVVGTPYWMSPEVIKGDQGYDGRADVWSVGCTIVEMLTTNPPWSSLDPNPAMFKIATLPTNPELPTDVSQACRDFIRVIFVAQENRPTSEEISTHSWVNIHD